MLFDLFVTYLSFWHAGLLVPLLICLLWISWPTASPTRLPYETACRLALAAVAVVQILWSVNAIVYDHSHDYSGDRAAAEFLKPYVENGSTIITTFIDQDDNHSFQCGRNSSLFQPACFCQLEDAILVVGNQEKSD